MSTCYTPTVLRQFSHSIVQKLAAVLVVLFFVVYNGLYLVEQRAPSFGIVDYPVFYVAAGSIAGTFDLSVEELYTSAIAPHIKSLRPFDGGFRFLYPPQAAVLLAPLSWLDFQDSYRTMALLSSLAMVAAYYVSVALVDRWWFQWRYSALLLALTFSSPVHEVLRTGNINGIVWLLLMLAVWWTYQHRQHAAGAILAVAASIKLFPAVFIMYWVIRKRWRALAAFCIATILLMLGTVALIGVAPFQKFYETRAEELVIEGNVGRLDRNTSLYGSYFFSQKNEFPNRTKQEVQEMRERANTWHVVATFIAAAMVCIVLFYYRHHNSSRDDVLDYSIGMLFLLLFSRGIHQQYQLWIVPILLLGISAPVRWRSIPIWIVTLASIYLTQFFLRFPWPIETTIGFLRPDTLAMLVLWIMAMVMRAQGFPQLAAKKDL